MQILLDSNSEAITRIVELCCEKVEAKIVDTLDADFIIKDLGDESDIFAYDQDKVIFLVSKEQNDRINVRFKVVKPFLPDDLIKVLISLIDNHKTSLKLEEVRSKKNSQNINNLSKIIKEIEDLQEDCVYHLNELDDYGKNIVYDDAWPDEKNLEDIAKELESNFSNITLIVNDYKSKTIEHSLKEIDTEDASEDLYHSNIIDNEFINMLEGINSEKNLEDIAKESELMNDYKDSFSDAPVKIEEVLQERYCDAISNTFKEPQCVISGFKSIDFKGEDEALADDTVIKIDDVVDSDICVENESKVDTLENDSIHEPFGEVKKVDMDAIPVAVMSFDESCVNSKSKTVDNKKIEAFIKDGLQNNIIEFFSNSQMKDILKDMKIKIQISFEDK